MTPHKESPGVLDLGEIRHHARGFHDADMIHGCCSPYCFACRVLTLCAEVERLRGSPVPSEAGAQVHMDEARDLPAAWNTPDGKPPSLLGGAPREEEERLAKWARTLAMLAIQSNRYQEDAEYSVAVDEVLAMTYLRSPQRDPSTKGGEAAGSGSPEESVSVNRGASVSTGAPQRDSEERP